MGWDGWMGWNGMRGVTFWGGFICGGFNVWERGVLCMYIWYIQYNIYNIIYICGSRSGVVGTITV
jgi:hypothetical protein